ncbi:Eco57I restriction-modification methylase domain-containing protein [Xylocopilactobacillus apicola]|uniref:Restriction endonuclease n=1 Tax=Xylocopilactobacillus apicola TaxID=2932184 RepID=A0AAU9CUV1_9LACO|nr:Eco57I restriction-modification methylase domain-containing protein [Xylocopilactobacillus apicola]BDR57772.1 restriction endonuclease [Xylocopilactobacillus apicola]
MEKQTTTKSNFEFLQNNLYTQAYYDTAHDAEDLYADGKFSNEFESIRKVAENVASEILDQEFVEVDDRSTFNDRLRQIKERNLASKEVLDDFYYLKQSGNEAAHTLKKASKEDGYKGLQKMYHILVWFVRTYYDPELKVNKFVEPHQSVTYQTAERKLIYVQTADNEDGEWPQYRGLEKIGDASIPSFEMDSRPNSEDLRSAADKRVGSYMKTAGVPYNLQWAELAYRQSDHYWFRDYDVHDVLLRSGIEKKEVGEGNEWFKTDLDTAKKAIKAVKEGRSSIEAPNLNTPIKIVLRPEQSDAVKKTEQTFKKHHKMLWNAKMRFGKTLTALQLIKDEKYKHVLIMTHRPVVDQGWFDDFTKIGMGEAGYIYGSKKEGEDFSYLANTDKPFVYFASLQDLRGSELVGGTIDKNRELFNTDWDLVIIDEAHEGTQTELAQQVLDQVVQKDHTKLLELSGTPFNLMDQYEEDQVYTWDYVMEQKAKYDWSNDHPDEKNPYDGLPKVSMYTFEMQKKFDDSRFVTDERQSFNFKEFFRVDKHDQFVYEAKVKQFLDNISTPDKKTNYPFSTEDFRNQLRHTLWIMPGVKEANALEDLMNRHPVFGMDYNIVNVVRNGDNGITSESDIKRVNEAMKPDPANTKTITLTVRKLTTGVTIKPWTGVLFLSNTNSAMQYLQAAFRAQTPYSSPTFGQKTNCYIFDFAPDRALTIMAESTQLKTGVGKVTSSVQKEKMSELMNFLPIIGETGQGMKAFKVDSLLAKIKRVYAEKAVRSGFDDDSLYSDELLKIQDADLKDFDNLKAIVGTTQADKKPLKVDINHQGLSDEEYEAAVRAEKKPKKERSLEEQAAIDKMNSLKKQRKTLISILRSISIRIPLMIYGMDVELEEDVDIKKFIKNVDDQSWIEFMPKGVTKELFKQFTKYFDQDVFIEAGKIIRRRVKALDKLDPIERVEQLTAIFSTFKNPDKETVLTPWRVVNMQLGMTLGGYSFFDEHYQYETIEGKRANHWIETEYTNQIFNPESHILEINSKTGLYPLYATMSIYWQEYQKLNNEHAGKFDFGDQLDLWAKILKNNIFVIAKTPMAKAITQRTLSGFRGLDTNIEFVKNIVEDSKKDVDEEAKKIKGMLNNMKFDVVIGNPPYQDESRGDNDKFAPPIYNEFMELSYKLSDLVILITPARFLFGTGSTPKNWNRKMLSDNHFKIIKYVSDSSSVFPKTDIKGGVVITLYDKEHFFSSIHDLYNPAGIFVPYTSLVSIMKKVLNKTTNMGLDKIVYAAETYKFTDLMHKEHPSVVNRLSNGHKYDLKSNVFDNLNDIFFEFIPNDNKSYIKIYGIGNKHRTYRYIRKDYILSGPNFNNWKVYLPNANGSGSLGEVISSPFIGKPGTGNTQTFISIGNFNSEYEANSTLKYIKTKFARTMLGILKVTQNGNKDAWRLIPLQDFTPNSDIDWSKSITEIDQQLYRKYDLSEDEINFIETKVQAMD